MIEAVPEGQAYVLLEVEPKHSRAVAKKLSGLHPTVLYSAAVWGSWDVILRVQADNTDGLIKFISHMQTQEKRIRRTETYFVRPDQVHRRKPWPEGTQWAFILMKTRADRTAEILKAITKFRPRGDQRADVLDVAGVLGRYDIALTVRYFDDTQLANLVMTTIQKRSGIMETTTMPCVAGCVFYDGLQVA